jgi:hypothetical protein
MMKTYLFEIDLEPDEEMAHISVYWKRPAGSSPAGLFPV